MVQLWDADSGKELAVLAGHTGQVMNAAFSPDGTRIVTAGDNTARVWDASGNELTVLAGHTSRVNNAALNSYGTRIVTVSDDTARVWDARSGKELAILKGHKGNIVSAAFSPDGTRIVTASYEDNTVRLWEIFANTQVSNTRENIPRCLTAHSVKRSPCPPEPPLWCIELEKWPYHTPAWKQWLSNKTLPLPTAP